MRKDLMAQMFLVLFAVTQCGIAQTGPNKSVSWQIYQVPFGSSGNTIELTVANSASIPVAGLTVEATEIPPWLKFAATEQRIALLKGQQETQATFTFAVDKLAPVQKNQTLKFVICAPTGGKWTKEITVVVTPPEKFEAYQNFPNPFNPSTAISYQLSAVSKVSLKIYNMLGQEVASLVDGDRLAGYHQEMWDAARYSSGVYIYQLILTDEQGSQKFVRKRMLLLK